MAEKNQQVDGEAKKSSKLLIIIIGVVLLVTGSVAGTYFFMSSNSADAEQTEEVEQAEEEGSAETENSGPSEILYYDIDKPLIVDFPKGSSARLIQVSVSLMVENQDALDALKKHDPMIRNNLLMLISAQDPESLKTTEGKQKLRVAIFDEVGAVLKKMTGKNDVKEVFFTAFVMQ